MKVATEHRCGCARCSCGPNPNPCDCPTCKRARLPAANKQLKPIRQDKHA